tara:strand:- start:20892 stop:23789 length:2898 start_codon:yes stop_codon:yes gene_type:complete
MKKALKSKVSTTASGKPKDEIVLNPAHTREKKSGMNFSEAITDTAVVTFGRMNPPTVGHLALVEKMLSISLDERAQPLIFLSHSYDPKKNPLAYEEKLSLVKKAFGEEFVAESNAKNMFDMLIEVNKNFKNVIVVVGEDRIKDLERITSTYNGKDFHYESMQVVNAGLRDPDSDGIEGMSASKMRELAVEGNLTEFREGLPSQLHASAEVIINMIREGMNLSEELNKIFETYLDEAGVLSVAGRRKKAVAARKYKSRLKIARKRVQRRIALNPRLKKRTARASIRIMRNRLAGGRGKSYSKLSAQEKSSIDRRVRARKNIISKLSSRLLPQTRRKEFSRFKSFREAAENINYSFESMLSEGAGLWHNIHKKRKEGRPMRKPGSKGAPTKQNFKDAAEGTYMGTFDKDAIDKHDKKKKKKKDDSTAQAHGDQLEHGEIITHESYQLSDKALNSLIEKAEKSNLSIKSIIEYYTDGHISYDGEGSAEQAGFKRVNEAIAKGKTDADALFELNRHGVPKDATKAELKKIRSTGSPGAKKLAHWKLNMHHNEELKVSSPDLQDQLDELSSDTLNSYRDKALKDASTKHRDAQRAYDGGNYNRADSKLQASKKRVKSMNQATDKLNAKRDQKAKVSEELKKDEITGRMRVKGPSHVSAADINNASKKYAVKPIPGNPKYKGKQNPKFEKESYSGEPEHIIQQAKRDQEDDRSKRLKGMKDKKKAPLNPNVRPNPNMSIKEGGDVKDYIEVKGGNMSKAEIAKLVKSRKKEMSETAGLMGTDALRKRYEMGTPGQGGKYEVAVDGTPYKDGIHKPNISTFKEQTEKFKPHMMYDPDTGEGKMAKVKQDHLDMKKKGWGHDKPEVKEAVFDAETPRKGIQKTRQHLSFKSSKPKVYRLRQKQDLYKKDDDQASKEKKSEGDRRYPEWVYKKSKTKKTTDGTPTRQPTKKNAYKSDGERSDKYGGDNHPITKH